MNFHSANIAKKKILLPEIHFGMRFVSLISPQVAPNLKFFFIKNKNSRLVLKQSYILMTWFYYLNFVNIDNSSRKCNFFSLPIRQNHYTILKAPIAHKTWSKEQIKLKFYFLTASFYTTLTEDCVLTDINSALVFAMITKKKIPAFETNLLFLKSFTVNYFTSDYFFFNYYKFFKI